MKLRAKVIHPEAALEISQFYEQGGYQVTIIKEGKHHCIYSTIDPLSAKPIKTRKKQTETPPVKPMLSKIEREVLYWIVCAILGFIFLRLI